MGQYLGAFDNHLVGVVVAVIAGLGKNGNGGLRDRAAVLISHHLAHEAAGGLGHRVQDGLREAVTDGSVEALAVNLDGLHHGAQVTEIVGFLPHQLGLDILVDEGDEILGQEQGVPSAGTGVLHGGAVAGGDLAVLQHQHHGDGLAGLTHGAEALGHRLAHIEDTIVTGTGLDGPLIVKVKAGTARGAYHINNLHFIFSFSATGGTYYMYTARINTGGGPPGGPYRWSRRRQ